MCSQSYFGSAFRIRNVRFSKIVMDYGDITGDTELKKEILSLYTRGTIDQITTTHGCIQANELVMATLLEKGDHVITCIPWLSTIQ